MCLVDNRQLDGRSLLTHLVKYFTTELAAAAASLTVSSDSVRLVKSTSFLCVAVNADHRSGSRPGGVPSGGCSAHVSRQVDFYQGSRQDCGGDPWSRVALLHHSDHDPSTSVFILHVLHVFFVNFFYLHFGFGATLYSPVIHVWPDAYLKIHSGFWFIRVWLIIDGILYAHYLRAQDLD